MPAEPNPGQRPDGESSLGSGDEFSRLKRQFLASLNHEIRTPVSGIMGMIDVLLETDLDEEQKGYIHAAQQCASELLALLNATLEYSDLSAGRVHLEEEEFEPAEVVRDAAAAFISTAEGKGLTLACTLDQGLPGVAVGDASRVRQLLACVIDNAVKFTHEGGVQVCAFAGPLDNERFWLTVEVRDTGIGMARDTLHSIFESFHQLDGGLARSYRGLGLGLALAQKVANLLGGEISVESAAGCGSTFFVRVPLKIAPMRTQPSSPPARPRILLVEDNDVAQRVVSFILRRSHYDVRCASSGADALQAASAQRYDLILMDLQMPGMDGLETTTKIRRIDGYDAVPVLALTANATDEYRRLCLEHGMQGFLSKPIRAKDLLAAISEFTGSAVAPHETT